MYNGKKLQKLKPQKIQAMRYKICRAYYMAVQGYEISLGVLKKCFMSERFVFSVLFALPSMCL